MAGHRHLSRRAAQHRAGHAGQLKREPDPQRGHQRQEPSEHAPFQLGTQIAHRSQR